VRQTGCAGEADRGPERLEQEQKVVEGIQYIYSTTMYGSTFQREILCSSLHCVVEKETDPDFPF